MSDGYGSGDGGAAIVIRSVGETQSGGASTSDELLSDITGSRSRNILSMPVPQFPQQRKSEGKESPAREHQRRVPEARDAIRRHWMDAKQKCSRMVLAAKAQDLVELSNATSDLDYTLGDLWKLREYREVDWRGVLDFLQGVLKYTWKIGGGFETLSVEQCETIATVVTDHLSPSTVDKEDVRSTLKKLRRAGLDPWAALSGEPKE